MQELTLVKLWFLVISIKIAYFVVVNEPGPVANLDKLADILFRSKNGVEDCMWFELISILIVRENPLIRRKNDITLPAKNVDIKWRW